MGQETCPRCGKACERLVNVVDQQATPHEVIFHGCANCLVADLRELRGRRSSPCALCGSPKERIVFSGVGVRHECPIHAYGRGLLSQCLTVLKRILGDREDPEANDLAMKLVDVLTVQEQS